MAPRTRSTNTSPVKKPSNPPTEIQESKHIPVKIIIAPRHLSNHARILSLQHPSDASMRSFLFCADNGLFELKATTVSSIDPRSIIFTPPASMNDATLPITTDGATQFSEGFVNKDAEILTATPYDLAFVLLRFVAPEKPTNKKNLFQPLEDILDSPESNDTSLQYILKNGQALVHNAMSKICDIVQAGDEEMFRYNEEKVFHLVIERAQRIAESGLPASLEDRFVARVLEAPMLSIKREISPVTSGQTQTVHTEDVLSQDGSFDSQSAGAGTTSSTADSDTSTSTVLTVPEDTIPAEVKRLQRIKTAYNFIVATCLPMFVASRIAPLLTGKVTPINFAPLEEYIRNLMVLRAEAAASRSMSDFSRKRDLEDDEIADMRAEKKRKQEDDEKKKKANESRGVRELKKVNVSGMKKMSDFFTKKPANAKTKT